MFEPAFDSLQSFLQMGKHGLYVWLCYGLSVLTVILNVVIYRVKKKRIVQEIILQYQRQEKQKQNL